MENNNEKKEKYDLKFCCKISDISSLKTCLESVNFPEKGNEKGQ